MASVAFLSHFTVGVQGGESRQTDTHRHTVHTHTFMPYTHKHTESHLYPLPKAHRQVHSLSQPPQPVTVCTGGQVDDVEEHVLALHHVHGQVGEADVVLHEVRHRDQRLDHLVHQQELLGVLQVPLSQVYVGAVVYGATLRGGEDREREWDKRKGERGKKRERERERVEIKKSRERQREREGERYKERNKDTEMEMENTK